jgi:hypothetical protein
MVYCELRNCIPCPSLRAFSREALHGGIQVFDGIAGLLPATQGFAVAMTDKSFVIQNRIIKDMANRKNVTLEKLAAIVKRGFDETAKKADMDARFDEKLKNTKEELQSDIAGISRIPEGLGRRVDRTEDDIRLIKTNAGMR